MPGNIIDGRWSKKRYVVLKPLGKGGFGTVYLVTDVQTGAQMALKISRDMLALVREFTILEKLNNMNIGSGLVPRVELLDDSVINSQIFGFISMEYVEGMNLRGFLKCRRFSFQEIFGLIKLLGTLLNLLHKYGYAYCDLKPENLLFDTKRSTFRLIDFGAVREIGSSVTQFTPAFDRASYGCGTRRADPGYDVFALSALMVALATGKDPQPKNPELADAFGAVATVWKRARQNRYQDIDDLLGECEGCLRYMGMPSRSVMAGIYGLGLFSLVVFTITLMNLLR